MAGASRVNLAEPASLKCLGSADNDHTPVNTCNRRARWMAEGNGYGETPECCRDRN
jgi:hypothetical protein